MADADVTMVLTGDDGRTAATVTTEVELSGKVATMGQGVLQDVSGRLVQTFATNLAAMLEGGAPPQDDAPARPMREPEPAPAGEGPPPAEPSPGPATSAGAGAAAGDALDLGSIGGALVAERLRDPRRLAGVLAAVALLAFWLGRRSAGG
jgi:hypothetical protein